MSSGDARPAIYLSTPGLHTAGRRPPPLARFFKLDVWGPSQLNTRARFEMASAAALLAIVFLFEFVAWSTLFNVIAHAGTWTLGGKTLVALCFGAVFASAVLLFERGIITADLTGRSSAFSVAVLVRLVVICASALATAQPVELLVFGQEIDGRLRDEAVRAEAVRQLGEEQRDSEAGQASHMETAKAKVKQTDNYRQLENQEKKVAELEAETANLDLKVAELRAQREALEKQVSGQAAMFKAILGKDEEARSSRETEDLRRLNSTLPPARRKLADLTVDVNTYDSVVTKKRAELNEARERKDARVKEIDAAIKAEADKLERQDEATKQRSSDRREWLRAIQRAPVGTRVEPFGNVHQGPWNPYEAGFVRRLEVLTDLRRGESPTWGDVPRGVRERAAQVFGIAERTDDEDSRRRLAARAQNFRFVYAIAFVVALVLPLLTLAFKLLMGRELRLYYSTLAQARGGNPEAIAVINADRGARVWRTEAEGA